MFFSPCRLAGRGTFNCLQLEGARLAWTSPWAPSLKFLSQVHLQGGGAVLIVFLCTVPGNRRCVVFGRSLSRPGTSGLGGRLSVPSGTVALERGASASYYSCGSNFTRHDVSAETSWDMCKFLRKRPGRRETKHPRDNPPLAFRARGFLRRPCGRGACVPAQGDSSGAVSDATRGFGMVCLSSDLLPSLCIPLGLTRHRVVSDGPERAFWPLGARFYPHLGVGEALSAHSTRCTSTA